MYYPFIRGRQYDLLAIRQLNLATVLPIIEPVVDTGAPLASYRRFVQMNLPFILIANPQVGTSTQRGVRASIINGELATYNNYELGYIVNGSTTLADLTAFCTLYANKSISIIHYDVPPNARQIATYINGCRAITRNVFFNVRLNATYEGYYRGKIKVTLHDGFIRAANNAAYAANPVQHFHDLHVTYGPNGYDGFSDFCTIGETYIAGGFTPLAVTIHMTNVQRAAVNAHHFVSNNIVGRVNTAGKYGEAVAKLNTFIGATPRFIHTTGSGIFQAHHTNGTFPGLPSIKKLSIMHHIELMSRY